MTLHKPMSWVLAAIATLWLANATAANADSAGAGNAPPDAAPRKIADNLGFPEGPVFVGNVLYFVDYSASSVLRLVDGKVEIVWHKDGCGANGLLAVPSGLLVACFDGGTIERISTAGKNIATISRDATGQSFTAPNDLAADAHGGVYFTASGAQGNVPGKVFYLDSQGRVTEVASDIAFANGVVVALDGKRLYVLETPAGRMLSFAIAPDGSLSERRTFVTFGTILKDGQHRKYRPDGLRLDRHGNFFVGLYDGGGIAVLSPEGRVLAQIDLPGTHHASLAISPDGTSIDFTAVDDTAGGGYRGALYSVANPVAP